MTTETTDATMDFHGALADQVLPFWERSVDREHGGFITEIDVAGNRHDDGAKYLVMQARMIYTFALGYRLTGRPAYLAHAAQGVNFLSRHFRDDQYGGWFWTTTRQGVPLDQTKHPYGLAFAAYALAEYARSSLDSAAGELAVDTYDFLWRHAWDGARGGIFWQLARDGAPVDASKRVDAMLHTMEAASSLFALTRDTRYLDDLSAIVETIATRTFDARCGCTREWFTPDWEELTDRTRKLVNYGHIAEAAWFVSTVAAFTGNRQQLDFGRSLLGYVLRHGWDDVHGGIASLGKGEGGVVDPTKTWWMQAELLGALSLTYRLTGDPLYYDGLRAQAAFVYYRQRDPRDGEWYSTVYADGTIRDGKKGSAWKAAYHVAQGLYHAGRNLALLEETGATVPGDPRARWEDFAP